MECALSLSNQICFPFDLHLRICIGLRDAWQLVHASCMLKFAFSDAHAMTARSPIAKWNVPRHTTVFCNQKLQQCHASNAATANIKRFSLYGLESKWRKLLVHTVRLHQASGQKLHQASGLRPETASGLRPHARNCIMPQASGQKLHSAE